MQTPTSKSATVNHAAKDDILQTNDSNVYDFSTILNNDPGSAQFQGFLTDGVINNNDGTFSLADDFSETFFQYQVEMANGTFSTATVSLLTHLDSTELIQNWSFEDGQTTTNGAWIGSNTIPSWTNNNDQSLEIVSAGYKGIEGDGHWLDTQASPGGIDISQNVSVNTGAVAQLSISISAEQFDTWATNPNEHLEVYFNGAKVIDVTAADLGDYNNFHTITANVVGAAGDDTLHIVSAGADPGFVGFALDSISLHQFDLVA